MGCFWWAILIPLIDLLLVSRSARLLGSWLILWLVLSAAVGLASLRTRGFTVFSSKRSPRPMPALERGAVFLAGILLIIPGPVSDVLGLLLLLPPIRRKAVERFRETLLGRKVGSGEAGSWPWGSGGPFRGSDPTSGGGRRRGSEGDYPGAANARDVEFEELPPEEGRGRPDGPEGSDRPPGEGQGPDKHDNT